MYDFKIGKVPSEILIRNVFHHLGSKDSSVILRPSIGEDAALISFGKQVIVLTTDPITSTTSDIGRLAIHINANDIACRGAKPRWFLCDILLPETADSSMLDKIMKQIDKAAKEIGVAVVGGHTEVTPSLARPIVVGYMMGVVRRGRYVTSSGAKPGDQLIMTKSAAIEGTAILATDLAKKLKAKLGAQLLARAVRLRQRISVIDDALTAIRAGGVRAMHDPTEGGILQGIWELAEASKVGFLIHEERITILPETRKICTALGADPLRLMSSGCLLIAAESRKSGSIIGRLKRKGLQASIIGNVTSNRMGRRMLKINGSMTHIVSSERDEIYRILEPN